MHIILLIFKCLGLIFSMLGVCLRLNKFGKFQPKYPNHFSEQEYEKKNYESEFPEILENFPLKSSGTFLFLKQGRVTFVKALPFTDS